MSPQFTMEPERPEQLDQEMAEAAPEDAGAEEEAPEDDFFEADASAEVSEDEDQGAEFNSDDEEVSASFGWRGACVSP